MGLHVKFQLLSFKKVGARKDVELRVLISTFFIFLDLSVSTDRLFAQRKFV